MANTIITKNSATASAVPTSGDLVQGELAVNVTDKRLFTENSGGTVVELGTNPSQLNFADNAKAIFGAGSDLQIYHDGTHSIIKDAGVGYLKIGLSDQGTAIQNSAGNNLLVTSATDVSLRYDGSEKLATTSTGIDVTGTVVSDGLTVDGSGGAVAIEIKGNNGTLSNTILRFTDTDPTSGTGQEIGKIEFYSTDSSAVVADIRGVGTDASPDGNILFRTAEGTTLADRLRIENTGDISFYEDTGTTPKFFWDASAESLGIGTSSPQGLLELYDTVDPMLYLNRGGVYARINTDSAGTLKIQADHGNTAADSKIQFFVDGGVKATIDSAGNVGIGETSPIARIHALDRASSGLDHLGSFVGGTGNTSGAGAYIGIGNAAGTTRGVRIAGINTSGPSGAHDMVLYTNVASTAPAERVRITSNGSLLVGTTSGGYQNSNSIAIQPLSLGAYVITNHANGTVSGREYSIFTYNASAIGSITQNGTTGVSYNTSSDYRLKEDWQPMTGASERVKALKPVNFAWKADGSRVDGFLAHEAQAVVPEAVHGEKDAVDAEGKPVYQGIDQSKLVPLLTAALQEALAKIESLEARLDAANL